MSSLELRRTKDLSILLDLTKSVNNGSESFIVECISNLVAKLVK